MTITWPILQKNYRKTIITWPILEKNYRKLTITWPIFQKNYKKNDHYTANFTKGL